MKKMRLYDNKEIEWKECPGCEFANHNFSLSCDIAYENDIFRFKLQDFTGAGMLSLSCQAQTACIIIMCVRCLLVGWRMYVISVWNTLMRGQTAFVL